YYYYVTAYNSAGESKPSNIASAILQTAPSAPLNLEVKACALQKVSLGWEQPIDTGGASITQYNIYRSTSTNYSLIGTTTNLFYDDYNPIKDFINYYYVTALNSIGEGPSSNIASCNLTPGGACWAKTYGGVFWDQLNSLSQTSDGGYIAAGYAYYASLERGLVLKLNSDGTIAWSKIYAYYDPGGIFHPSYLRSISQTSDGGYIAGGVVKPWGESLIELLIIKLDSSGNIQWAKMG
ncbi:MAG: hypothetical protein ACP5JU_04110, partial [Minisyncoccia bacterium]